MSFSVTQVVNVLLHSDKLFCPFDQSAVAVAGATNVVNTRQWEAVTVSLFSLPPHPPTHEPHCHYPQAFCTLPSFAHIERPRWRPVELSDQHLRSHRKIGDCEQSTCRHSNFIEFSIIKCYKILHYIISYHPRKLFLISDVYIIKHHNIKSKNSLHFNIDQNHTKTLKNTFKVPISSTFLFSYLILCISQ